MRPRNLQKEEAIRTLALKLIAEEGLENLTIQKLASAAGISVRTIYLKYENKEDLLIKLFLDEVLGSYEKATLKDFNPAADFAEGVRQLWTNVFTYLTANRWAFALLQYGRSSPLLNKAYQTRNMQQGTNFQPVHQFLSTQVTKGVINEMPFDAFRAMLFAPLLDLVAEYFDYQEREQQIITPALVKQCCEAVIKGLRN